MVNLKQEHRPGRRHRDRPDADFNGGGHAAPAARCSARSPAATAATRATRPRCRRWPRSFPMRRLDGMTLGASVSAPFGLKTEYDPDWVGRYNAIRVRREDRRPDPVGRVRSDRRASRSASALIYERAEVTLSNAIDFGTAHLRRIRQRRPTASTRPFPFQPAERTTALVDGRGRRQQLRLDRRRAVAPDRQARRSASRTVPRSTTTSTARADFTMPASVAAVFGALGVTRRSTTPTSARR